MKKTLLRGGLLLCLLMVPSLSWAKDPSARLVRVGAFNYYPAIFKDTDGAIKGFYVDLFDDLARRENLRIEYVYGSWAEGLQNIRSGAVDVLTSVAHTPERALFLDYSTTPLLTVWGELYVPLGSEIDSLLKVRGKTVAVLESDINGANFIELVKKFDIPCAFVKMSSFDEVFRAVAAKKVDAGVVNSTFGIPKHLEYGLRSSGVVFNPFDIFFTVAKGQNQALLELLDDYLDTSRDQESSVYIAAQRAWFHGNTEVVHVFPRWLEVAGALFVLLLMAAVVFISLLRKKVKQATNSILEREASLRERSEMIHLLLDSTAEAIYGIDLQGRCTFCNAASVRLLGYKGQEELLGRNMHELMHHTHSDGTPFPVADCAIYQAFQKQEQIHVDSEVLWRADGTCFAAEYWSYPVFREGKVIGSVVTFLDISSRKQAEEALKEKSAELERFTYAVSHDLKSPLVTIKAFLGFLKQDVADADAERIDKDMTFLHTAVDKMERLLEELLEMARIGRIVNLPVAVSMAELVDEALAAVAGRIAERGVEVRVTAETVQFFGDRPRLVEIWQNLIDNAVKYMGGQTTPCIDIGSESGPEGTVFYVRDNGMGIEPGFHGKVFGLFEKLDQCSEGSGLGLALVKRIVELNGGRIWVESAGVGEGSCFRFTLPAAMGVQQGKPQEKVRHG